MIKDKVAIITGASSGIGFATALKLSKAGAKVAIGARRLDRLKDLANKITSNGGEVFFQKLDVTDRSECEMFAKAVLDKWGSNDILVNNAGLMPLSFLRNGKSDEANKMVDVNIKGVMNLVYAVLPQMIEQNQGHFVNISSVAGKLVMPAGAVYSGTKFFVRAFSEGLRQEMAMIKKNVRVTDIQPGAVTTELMNTITDPDVMEAFKQMGSFDFLEAVDIARGVSYAVAQPDNVNVNEVTIRPTMQPF